MGTRLGEFEILRELGAGGFGMTYLAQDRALEVTVVIKEFFPRVWASRDGLAVNVAERHADDFAHFLKRFLEEARTAAQLNHPNLVKVIRYFEANNTGYFVMPYLEGETLEQRLDRHPDGLETRACIDIIAPVLSALGTLHDAGLLHRDIKPGNIYLRKDGAPLLIDLGAARSFIADAGGMTAMVSHGYAPPEQYAWQSEQGPWTDLYAVAAVMYRMLCGSDPLEAPARAIGPSATRLHLSMVSRALPNVPAGLAALVDRGLELAPEDRPQSTREFIEALEFSTIASINPARASTAELQGSQGMPQNARARSNRWWIAATILLIAVVTGYWLTQDPAAPELGPANAPAGDVSSGAKSSEAPVQRPESTPVASEPVRQAGIVVDDGSPAAMLARVRSALPPRDLVVNVALDPPGPTFVEGDRIAIGFSVREAAYPLVLAYSQDGSVTLLYPNDFAKAKRVEADRMFWVGEDNNPFRIEVAPPFGRDVIHVMAFRRHEDLQLLIEELKLAKLTADLYSVDRDSLKRSIDTVLTRGFRVVAEAPVQEGKSGGWGDREAWIDTGAQP